MDEEDDSGSGFGLWGSSKFTVMAVPRISKSEDEKQVLLSFHQRNQGKAKYEKIGRRFFDKFVIGFSPSGDLKEGVELLLKYLVKKYNEPYVELAKDYVKEEEVVQHDGTDSAWNKRYTELLRFKEVYGKDAMPPRTVSKDASDYLKRLASWVGTQRTLRRNKDSILYRVPKRMELLDAVGFDWGEEVINQRNLVDDPLWPKAIAAKVFFEKKLLAREAMLMSGFSEEDATNDTMKKNLNAVASTWKREGSKKHKKTKTSVMELLGELRKAYQNYDDDGEDPEEALGRIFGETDTLSELLEEKRLVPRPIPEVFNDLFENEPPDDEPKEGEPPAKKQRLP